MYYAIFCPTLNKDFNNDNNNNDNNNNNNNNNSNNNNKYSWSTEIEKKFLKCMVSTKLST